MTTRMPALPATWVPDPTFGLLGKQVGQVADEGFRGAMSALWGACLWILKLVFSLMDKLASPDLSPGSPVYLVLPYTLSIAGALALILGFVQLGSGVWKRDGKSLARLLIGIAQLGAVLASFLAVAQGLVVGVAGLTRGLLEALLNVDGWGHFLDTASWPRDLTDTTTATVLGLCGIFLILPASIAYLVMMLARLAALLVLVVTAPINAAGLLSDVSKDWFWKGLRWFLSALFIPCVAALVLGLGVKATEGVVRGMGDDNAAAVGGAVVGCVLIAVGAICPIALYRLLAFVDPGTQSGAAMRAGMQGMSKLQGNPSDAANAESGSGSGSGATAQDGQGRAQGETDAQTSTSQRLSSALGGFGKAGQFAGQAAAIGADILGGAGVGNQSYLGADGQSQDNNQQNQPQKQRDDGDEKKPDGSGDQAGKPSDESGPNPLGQTPDVLGQASKPMSNSGGPSAPGSEGGGSEGSTKGPGGGGGPAGGGGPGGGGGGGAAAGGEAGAAVVPIA